ncbi:MAG TPA: SCP2 sterol-binding domain-containing protein [Pilimelia sp.]|nr:SCP2 sterol-binding domain-containing protein [Pilimelia sp.]
MAEFDPATFSSVDPDTFVQLVRGTSDARLKEIMSGPSRRQVLDEIFRRFPDLFRPEKAGDTEAVLHWTLTDRPDGGVDTYEVVISGGRCTTSGTPAHEPRLALTMAPLHFLRLITGSANPVMMFMTGKVKAKGDLGLAADMANLFDLPKG